MMASNAQCCIAGGGPAGMMAGYMLARAGIRATVLEKHGDFLRDFRGDTVHPSTLAVLAELGLLERFLRLPHQRIDRLEAEFGTRRVHVADLRGLDTPCPYVVFMPQWDFLNFLVEEARKLETFTLMMDTEVRDLIRDDRRIAGVYAQSGGKAIEIRAALTIGADGRHSIVREKAGLPRRDIGAPIDVLWFRVPRDPSSVDAAFAHAAPGKLLVTIDRGTYWQCAFVIPKGAGDAVKSAGLSAFRADVASTAPAIAAHIGDLKDWDDVKLLTVTIDRLQQWSRPGLLCIGDSAHAMSPVGGVGINLAIQDAVATANLLAGNFGSDGPVPDRLAAIQERREWPMRLVQGFQVQAQNAILQPIVSGENRTMTPPLPLRLLDHSPMLRGWLAHLIGLGVRQEHVRWT